MAGRPAAPVFRTKRAVALDSLENAIRLDESLPEAVRRVRIIGCMDAIVGETESVGHLHGHGHDLHLDAERPQHRHIRVVEIGDRLCDQRDRSYVSVARPRDQLVVITGLSGSGKTQIALKLGEWLGEDKCVVIPVRPDWTGPEPLFGYEDVLSLPAAGGRN